MVHGKLAPRKVDMAKRRALAMQLLNADLTYEQIAEQVRERMALAKYDKSQAYRDCMLAIKEITQRPAREYVANQMVDYVALKRTWRPLARKGDHKAAAILLRILDQEAKLLGLNAPTRTQVEITQHFEALAQAAVGALNAGLDALPELTREQRGRVIEAARAHLTGEQARQDTGTRAIIEHEPPPDALTA